MISTLKAIFQGKKELFEGLYITETNYDWLEYPVIHLDMGSCVADSTEELKRNLDYLIDRQAKLNDVQLNNEGCSARFQELIESLSDKGKKVVILVDEYDKPLLNRLDTPEVEKLQSVLKSFYGVIKTTEHAQRFAMITGISKFSKVSIFSDLNNLTDLTMTAPESTMLGYTQEELEDNFDEHIDSLAKAQGLSKYECLDKLKVWYNGYRFEDNAPTVYNPVSVMKCFQNLKFNNFWFETGTPSFLIKLLKEKPVDFGDLTLSAPSMDSYDPKNINPLTLLFQTGYLTIDNCETGPLGNIYHLRFPNQEVSTAFNFTLASNFSANTDGVLNRTCLKIIEALKNGDVDEILENMRILFSQVPNEITLDYEKYYQSLMFFILRLLGTEVDAEVSNNIGRMDVLIKTDDFIYVIEFKLNGTAEDALKQIEDKEYALQYINDERTLFKIGAEFSRKTRNISRWLTTS
jgi:hypothetical protein